MPDDDIIEVEDPPSTPDIVLEHGSPRLSLDLDGWEWFWLFLAIAFVSTIYLILS